MSEWNDDLRRLFRSYREGHPDFDAGPDFMPGLWQRIEARRSFAFRLGRYTRGLVSVAAVLCLAVGIVEFSGLSTVNPVYTHTYVEALDDDDAPEALAYSEIVHMSQPSSNEQEEGEWR